MGVLVVLVVLQAKDLLDVLDLLVLHNLVMLRLAHVQQLAAQREDAVVVAPNDTQSGDGKRLGGVTLRQDERAVRGPLRAGVVRIRQLRETLQPAMELALTMIISKLSDVPVTTFPVGLLQLLVGLAIGPVEDLVDDRRLLDYMHGEHWYHPDLRHAYPSS